MKKNPLILIILVFSLASCSDKDPSQIADTIFTNGKIYTVNEAQPWAALTPCREKVKLAPLKWANMRI